MICGVEVKNANKRKDSHILILNKNVGDRLYL